MKPTALSIPDLPDRPHQVDIETEQLENLQAAIGLTLWAALDEVEHATCTG